jgi:hypothetical protein
VPDLLTDIAGLAILGGLLALQVRRPADTDSAPPAAAQTAPHTSAQKEGLSLAE